jgi:hypothetical protein
MMDFDMFSPVPRLFLFQVIYFCGFVWSRFFFWGIPFLFHSGWPSSMPVIYPSDRFDRAPPPSFFVFAKLRNHQIIFFPSTNAERGIFVRRRRSLASVRGQCDAIATSSSFVDLSFMQRDCFDTHFQPTSISRGVFFGTDTWRGWS